MKLERKRETVAELKVPNTKLVWYEAPVPDRNRHRDEEEPILGFILWMVASGLISWIAAYLLCLYLFD
jgi:hypothetical protein